MRRIMVFLVSAALVAGALFAVPAAAQEAEAPIIPAAPNIIDDEGDAGQGTSSLGDVLAAWFTESGEKLSVHFHMRRVPAPPATAYGIEYRLYASPKGEDDCFLVRGQISSGTYAGENAVKVFDACGTGTSWFGDEAGEGELFYGTYPDDTGWVTLTFDKTLTGYSSDGSSLVTPRAQIHAVSGAQAGAFVTPMLDDTERGSDYAVGAGQEDVKETPPGKNDPPGKKKGCTKGNGKKRGCEGKGKKAPNPGPPSDSCAPFAPGEAGAGKRTVTLTDAATEENPLEQTVTLEQSVADADLVGAGIDEPSYDFFNVVVDSKAADAGLYATLEFPTRRDYDIDLLHTDGSYAARSHGFNPLAEIYLTPLYAGREGHGGKTTASSENLVGIKTSDCGGWTIQATNWLGEGGDLTVKLWLGKPEIDPQEPGKETP